MFAFIFHRLPNSTLFPYTTLFRSHQSNTKNKIDRMVFVKQSLTSFLPLHLQNRRPKIRPRLTSCSRSEEHTSELQSRPHFVCRLLLEKKKVHTYRLIQQCWIGQFY